MYVIQTIEGPLVLDSFVSDKRKTLSELAKRSYVAIEKGGSPLEFIVWYLACLQEQLVPVIVSVCDEKSVFSGVIRCLNDVYVFEKFENVKLTAPVGIDLVIQTSGSTGTAKFVAYHTDGMKYQAEATQDLLKYDSDSLVLCLSEIWSSYGLSLVNLWLKGIINLATFSRCVRFYKRSKNNSHGSST